MTSMDYNIVLPCSLSSGWVWPEECKAGNRGWEEGKQGIRSLHCLSARVPWVPRVPVAKPELQLGDPLTEPSPAATVLSPVPLGTSSPAPLGLRMTTLLAFLSLLTLR